MNFRELPEGNGQEIYVDIEILNIRREWYNEELQAIVMPEICDNNVVYEAYRKMFNYLFLMGYKMVIDSKLVNEDTFCWTPCFDKHINKKREEYLSKKKNKIRQILLNEGIEEPYTVYFPENCFPDNLPELPLVLKNEDEHGGVEKFLIRTREQLEILKRFYNEINEYDKEKRIARVKRQWSCYKDLEFDQHGRSKRGICVVFVDYKKMFHENMLIQKYIKTPTEYNTSLRVITSASGDILSANLKYSENLERTVREYQGIFDKYLANSMSPYYLGDDSIVSNTIWGGKTILLGRKDYSSLEKEILALHGISSDEALVPDEVFKASLAIARECRREIGAICGLDFIYDEENKVWKYLEEHEYPMLGTYAKEYDLPYDGQDFVETQILDIDARLRALALTMEKIKIRILVKNK